jgi:hypothetical protein
MELDAVYSMNESWRTLKILDGGYAGSLTG